MTDLNTMFNGQITMSPTEMVTENQANGSQSLDTKEYVDKFTIVDVEQQLLLTAEPIQFSTSYDLITVHNPDLSGSALSNTRSLQDALIGHFDANNNFDGYYAVNWDHTSLWHEMTLFQNSTSSRFFAIWGYFKGGITARTQEIGIDGSPLIFTLKDGTQVYKFKDDNFIDPAGYESFAAYEAELAKLKESGIVVKKIICGSFLNPEDIYTYYRIPRYSVTAARDTDGDGKIDIAEAWTLNKYDQPSVTEVDSLVKHIYQSSIVNSVYSSAHLQEVLPIEEYDTKGTTSAIVSSTEILKLFLNNTANSGCKNWARSTSNGGGRNASSGAVTNIANNGGYAVTITNEGEVQFT